MNFSIAFPWLRNSGRAGYPCFALCFSTVHDHSNRRSFDKLHIRAISLSHFDILYISWFYFMWYRIWCQLFYCMSPKNLHKYFKFSVDKLQLMLYDIKCVWQTWPTQQSMREWLSWWSTTLPRSGPRVRVPSRALFMEESLWFRLSFLFAKNYIL